MNDFEQLAFVCDLGDHRFQPVERFLQDAVRSSEADAQVPTGARTKPSGCSGNQCDTGLFEKLLAQIF